MQQIEYVSLDDLTPYTRNARTHSPGQIKQIVASIREFGFTNPVLIDGDGGIIAGHGRVTAAREMGMETVPCIRLGHLSEAQWRAYVIADNKLALNAGWDFSMLSAELIDLKAVDFNLDLIGFNQLELSELVNGPDFNPGTEADQGQLDEKTKVTCPDCGAVF
jgi:ParB-like chromosome segregation protein Spo0J